MIVKIVVMVFTNSNNSSNRNNSLSDLLGLEKACPDFSHPLIQPCSIPSFEWAATYEPEPKLLEGRGGM